MNEQGHLTSEERAAYWHRTLAPESLLEVSDHLQTCASCRQEMLEKKPPTAVTGAAAEPVSYEELVAWMDGDLDPRARRELAERITRSPKTSAELVNLLRFRDEINDLPAADYAPVEAQSRRFLGIPGRLLPLAAGLTIGLAFLWLTMIGREHARSVALVDQGQQLIVKPNGAIPALGELSGDLQAAVRDAVSLGKIDRPAHDLRRGTGELGGAATDRSFRALSPLGTLVEKAKPTLRWSAAPGATGYRVNLVKNGGEPIRGPILPPNQTSWMPNEELSPNETYEWEVEALRDGKLLAKAPAPPEPEARFRVLDPAGRAALEEQRAKFSGSHLVMGLAYAKAGLVAEARNEFEQLEKENPENPVPKKLLDGLTNQLPAPTRTNGAQ